MTERAQQVANDTAGHRQGSDSPLPGALLISGLLPVTVHVKYYAASTTTEETVGFGLHKHGSFFGDGIEWPTTADGDYAKFVTFELPPEVSKITCEGLFYSEHFAATPRKQDLCIVPLVGSIGKTYPFMVHFTSGTLHDPKIIVTPITLPGGGHH
jgi:hypothetical protein